MAIPFPPLQGTSEPVMRLAYLGTHPIQYQAPLLRRVAAERDIYLKAFFASDISLGSFQAGFETPIRWDVPLLDGYEYEFLPAFGSRGQISFWQPISYGFASRLKAARIDALWVHGYMRWHHWVAMATAKRLGIRVLIRDDATLISRIRRKSRLASKRAFFALLSKFVDGFLAVGTRNRDYFLNYGIQDRRIFSVPWAVDNQFFQVQAREAAIRRDTFRAELGIEYGRPIILFAGKLVPRKRPGDLLEAWARLALQVDRRQMPYLLFVGDGKLRGELEARASNLGCSSVRFVGFKNQTELPAYFDLCDVFVMPTVFEPWGLIVNEVMNAGKAVIASDQVGCVPDLVRHDYNGIVFKAGDVADLTRALRYILADPLRCREMGRRSLQIINRWSFEEDVEGLRTALNI
jgi:glycosyltransferase involved in cell wall biosynthesis